MSYLKVNGEKIHVQHIKGSKTHIFYLSGHRNDLNTQTGKLLEGFCRKNNFTLTRFENSGWGQSTGPKKQEGMTQDWYQEALAVFEKTVKLDEKVILCGFSMGGWFALALAQEKPRQVAGLVGISAGFGNGLCQQTQANYKQNGFTLSNGSLFSFETHKNHVTLTAPLDLNIPIILRYANKDPWVPKATADGTIQRIQSDHLKVIFEDSNDHSPKTEEAMQVIYDALLEIA